MDNGQKTEKEDNNHIHVSYLNKVDVRATVNKRRSIWVETKQTTQDNKRWQEVSPKH